MTQHNNDQKPSSVSPFKGRAAVYVRSTVSTPGTPSSQTAALIELATRQGYPVERITVYQDGDVPGKRALLRRGALSDLVDAITQEDQYPIRTIFVFSEARLFRDLTVVNVANFIKTCKERGITLITPASEYDFTDAAQVALFRFQYEQAIAFIERQARQLTGRTGHDRRSSKRTGE